MSELPKGWDNAERVHPQMYLKKVGGGEILYLMLGHCCGRFDMQPIMEECDTVRRSWDLPFTTSCFNGGFPGEYLRQPGKPQTSIGLPQIT